MAVLFRHGAGWLLSLLAVAACAFHQGIVSGANRQELLQQSGVAQLTLPLPAGGERWFYTTAPAGTQTYRIDLAADGRVIAREQVLTDAVFQDINAGLSAEEVRLRIGPPYRQVRFERTQTTSWDYFYRDSWGYYSDFCVIVNDAGIVTSKIALRRDPPDKDK